MAWRKVAKYLYSIHAQGPEFKLEVPRTGLGGRNLMKCLTSMGEALNLISSVSLLSPQTELLYITLSYMHSLVALFVICRFNPFPPHVYVCV